MSFDLPSVLADYHQHGFARLGRTLSDAQVEALRERTVDLMLGRVVHPGLFFQMDAATGDYRDAPLGLGWQGPSEHYRKLEKLELDDRFRALIDLPALEPVVRGLIPGPEGADARAVPVPVRAGESVLLHDLVWHRSGKTRTGQRRLGFSACYLGAGVRCARKKKTPRRFFAVHGGA